MPTETSSAIAYVGALVGLVGGAVALFNSWKGARWKRAELANAYLRDFNSNTELVFASRCLDWEGGKLVLPESLRPYVGDAKVIHHDKEVFRESLSPTLLIGDLDGEPRFQIYRVAIDSFLSWLSLVASALDRKLFTVRDIEEVAYWVTRLKRERGVGPFICEYGYQESIDSLDRRFRAAKVRKPNMVVLD